MTSSVRHTMADDSSGYVFLRRRFSAVERELSTWLSRRIRGSGEGESWDSIVPIAAPPANRSAVVVLAPSGVGKTSELRRRASDLRREGVAAFFGHAIDVATTGMGGAT